MVRICQCGIEVETIVCWSDDSPGRRLYVCCKEKNGSGCGWKDSKDPKMSERAIHTSVEEANQLIGRARATEKKIV